MALVEVRPVPSIPWHGKTGKEDFSQPKVYEVLLDGRTGRYATGLTDEEKEKFEKDLGVDLSSTFNPNEAHPYWGSASAAIKLPNHPVFFDTTIPAEAVKVKNMKAMKYVANSMREWEEGKFPDATHVIFDEQEELAIKASKIQTRRRCYEVLNKMSLDERANMAIILSEGDTVVNRHSQDIVDIAIDEIIEENPDKFMLYAKMDKNELYTRAAVLEALHRNILTKEGTAVHYMGDIIGYSTEEAIQWFMNPNNQALKVAILEKLQN